MPNCSIGGACQLSSASRRPRSLACTRSNCPTRASSTPLPADRCDDIRLWGPLGRIETGPRLQARRPLCSVFTRRRRVETVVENCLAGWSAVRPIGMMCCCRMDAVWPFPTRFGRNQRRGHRSHESGGRPSATDARGRESLDNSAGFTVSNDTRSRTACVVRRVRTRPLWPQEGSRQTMSSVERRCSR
jgi:hypothetical protein